MNPIFTPTKPKSKSRTPKADTINDAGGKAYKTSTMHQLVQMAVTGCFNDTYYASAQSQVAQVIELANKVPAEYLAKTAIYARKRGLMKDMPALLLAVLATRDSGLFRRVFNLVVDNEKMLKNFITVLRSGVTGRKSANYTVKKAVNGWLLARDPNRLFSGDVGSTPSLAQVIKLTHPKTEAGSQHDALFKYLLDKEYDFDKLPPRTREFEAYKKDRTLPVPDVPFQLLASLSLESKDWAEIAKNAPWQMLRMNLNTFQRHGVFSLKGMTDLIVKKLKDPKAIQASRVFPYQLLTAYQATKASAGVPHAILNALGSAVDIACENIPAIDGKVVLMPDTSGSMSSPATGTRKGSSSSTTCVDVAALVAAAFARKNEGAVILPFDTRVHSAAVEPGMSTLATAEKLARLGGGGTNCMAPLSHILKEGLPVDLAIFISDNESWVDGGLYESTGVMAAWKEIKKSNPSAKLVCIDITPNGTTQAKTQKDILNIGGFSDSIFEIISLFAKGELHGEHFVEEVLKVELPEE